MCHCMQPTAGILASLTYQIPGKKKHSSLSAASLATIVALCWRGDMEGIRIFLSRIGKNSSSVHVTLMSILTGHPCCLCHSQATYQFLWTREPYNNNNNSTSTSRLPSCSGPAAGMPLHVVTPKPFIRVSFCVLVPAIVYVSYLQRLCIIMACCYERLSKALSSSAELQPCTV